MRRVLVITDQKMHREGNTGGLEANIQMLIQRILYGFAASVLFFQKGKQMEIFTGDKYRPIQSIRQLQQVKFDLILWFTEAPDSGGDIITPELTTLSRGSKTVFMCQNLNNGYISAFRKIFPNSTILSRSLKSDTILNDSKIIKYGGYYDDQIFYNKKVARKPGFLCSARIGSIKCQLELVKGYKAIKELRGFPIILVGHSHEPGYMAEVRKYVDNKTVVYMPCQSHKEMANLYNKYKYHVLNSRRESFSISTLEAMACGMTCIVDGSYYGQPDEFTKYIIGSRREKTGKIHEYMIDVVKNNKNIDATQWVFNTYSITKNVERMRELILR